MSADEQRRLTPSERNHEALMAAISRPSRTDSVTVKENAKGDVLIDSLSVSPHEGEGWGPWLRRCAEMTGLLRAELDKLPARGNGGAA